MVHPGCRLTLFALPWAGGFWAFSPNGGALRIKVFKVVKVFNVSKDARRELRCIWRNSPHGSCTLYSVLCTLASLFRNNLRRILPHHGADVEGDDEEDDEGGKNDAEEDGRDGGDTFLVAEVLQELIEEDAYGDCNYACYSDKPQIEATEEQGNIPSLGAVNFA